MHPFGSERNGLLLSAIGSVLKIILKSLVMSTTQS